MTDMTGAELKPLLINTKQLKQILGVGDATLRYWVMHEGFPAPIEAGVTKNLWPLAKIEDWVNHRFPKNGWRNGNVFYSD